MAEPKPAPGGDAKTAAVVAAVAVILLLAPVFAGGALVWWIGRRLHLGRIEAVLITVTGVIALALLGTAGIGDYGAWLANPWTDRDWWQLPLALLPLTFIAGGILLLLSGTAIASKVGGKLPWAKKINPLEAESIVPTSEQRQHAKVVAPPGGVVPNIDDYSLMSKTPAGSRQVPLGMDRDGRPCGLNEAELGHMVIFGSTGSGKSVSIRALAGSLLDLGWDVSILDLKEDTGAGGLRDFCAEYATSHSLPYQELRLSDTATERWFNPFQGMNPDEAADAVLTLAPADDFFWGSLSSKMVRQALTLLYDAHKVDPSKYPYPTPYALGQLMSRGAQMPDASREMRAACLSALPDRSKDDYSAIGSPTQDEAKNAPGFGAKLVTIYQTEAGRAVLKPGNDKAELDITRSGLIYIGLDSQGKADLTRMVSSSLLQRISVWAAQRTIGGAAKQRAIIVDEAGWVNRQILTNLLARARGAKISMILATQGPLDWEVEQSAGKGQGVAGFNALANNFNVAMIMRQADPKSAEICADYLGTRTVYQTSQRITDDGLVDASARQTTDYWVAPEQLRELTQGEAVLRVGMPEMRLTYLRVAFRDATKTPGRF